MLRGWISSKKADLNASTHSLDALAESQNLEAAMRAATYIMDDDLEGAEAGLAHGNSTFHKMGKGMVAFLRATLGFEPEIMKEAAERLSDAEATASADNRKAQKDPNAHRSHIYPPGAEFALCHAMTQLMGAVVGVLNESLTESIRGFYKLRKAYVTLNVILEAEAQYMKKKNGLGSGTPSRHSVESLRSNRSARSAKVMPGGFGDAMNSKPASKAPSIRSVKAGDLTASRLEPNGHDASTVDDDNDEFYDADEDLEINESLDGVDEKMNDLSMDNNVQMPVQNVIPSYHGLLDHDPDSDVFSNPIDVFIHSGANLCFGLLLVMISMIPPAFSKLLFIIGFHGDKERGVRMLWQASKFHNINGAMAGLIVLGYYNTFVGFSDIIPDHDPTSTDQDSIEGYPKERCEALLADMRSRHPKSHLWLLEEARGQAANRHLSKAISMLEGSTKSPLKQVEALEMFEKSLDAMYMHDYALCAKSFTTCVGLNNWSHSLYYYIAGAANVELYRQHKSSNVKAAELYAKKATELLKLAPKHAGKKKFMARQLPFDIFVTRKVQKWEARASEWKVPLIDAVGVSPVEEMIFFWNGYKRMDQSQLKTSLDRLAWSDTSNPTWSREGPDEHAILSVLRGATYRNLARWDEAKEVLRSGVLGVDRAQLKGALKDDWTAPAAHYEMGVICWMQRGEAARNGGGAAVEEKLVRECESWIDKAAKWESYELDARIGLKIATAQDTLRKWNERRMKR
ncbi:tetratricopeptide repeat protein 39, partial [Lecanoromycetidae sp. Uapishka_2]